MFVSKDIAPEIISEQSFERFILELGLNYDTVMETTLDLGAGEVSEIISNHYQIMVHNKHTEYGIEGNYTTEKGASIYAHGRCLISYEIRDVCQMGTEVVDFIIYSEYYERSLDMFSQTSNNAHVHNEEEGKTFTTSPLQTENKIGETTMTQRKILSIALMDNDSNLPVENALVHHFGEVVSEDSNEVTIQQLLVDEDIKDILEKHNTVRGKVINQTILENTGSEVHLRPVTLKDLSWLIK